MEQMLVNLIIDNGKHNTSIGAYAIIEQEHNLPKGSHTVDVGDKQFHVSIYKPTMIIINRKR